MNEEAEQYRREILGDVAADLINELAEIKGKNIDPEIAARLNEFTDQADEDQLGYMNLAQMFMELAIAKNEKRLTYAAAAMLALSGALEEVGNTGVAGGDWTDAMDYAEVLWRAVEHSINELIESKVDQMFNS